MNEEKMYEAQIIIVRSNGFSLPFNYGDDYYDLTKIIVEDHSNFEKVTNKELNDLQEFVNNFNKVRNSEENSSGLSDIQRKYAFLIVKDDQISCKTAIDTIINKRKNEIQKIEDVRRKAEEKRQRDINEREKIKAEKALAKLQKTNPKLYEELMEKHK